MFQLIPVARPTGRHAGPVLWETFDPRDGVTVGVYSSQVSAMLAARRRGLDFARSGEGYTDVAPPARHAADVVDVAPLGRVA